MRGTMGVRAVAVAAVCLGLAVTSATSIRAGKPPQSPAPVNFDRDIRPILSNNCFQCHGPDEQQRETNFHFDTEDGAFVDDGIIVRRQSADRLLVKRILNPDPRERMPPPDSGHALTDSRLHCCADGSTKARSGARTGPGRHRNEPSRQL